MADQTPVRRPPRGVERAERVVGEPAVDVVVAGDGAADAVLRFQDQNVPAGVGEDIAGGQAVRPRADDHGVMVLCWHVRPRGVGRWWGLREQRDRAVPGEQLLSYSGVRNRIAAGAGAGAGSSEEHGADIAGFTRMLATLRTTRRPGGRTFPGAGRARRPAGGCRGVDAGAHRTLLNTAQAVLRMPGSVRTSGRPARAGAVVATRARRGTRTG